jgi:hypothetical protein
MPDEYMGNSREHLRTPSLTDSEEPNPNVKEPRTPAEYALHAVFTRFVVSADHKVDQFLKAPLVRLFLHIFQAINVSNRLKNQFTYPCSLGRAWMLPLTPC